MWQAMLIAAELPQTKHVVIDGFATGEGGIKMSKSIGNVINPYDVVNEYGTEALRYFALVEMSAFEDSPFTMERFKDVYNSKLANGIGNLTSRILKMAETNLDIPVEIPEKSLDDSYFDLYKGHDITKVGEYIWNEISSMDAFIQETTPFKVIKTDQEKGRGLIKQLVVRLYTVARMLNPILPETSEKIKKAIKENKMPEVSLFVRKD
jgi:methionyl-tRNA synthetase